MKNDIKLDLKGKIHVKRYLFFGMIFMCIPIFFMIITGIIGSIVYKKFIVDYMIPAELFPLILIGSPY